MGRSQSLPRGGDPRFGPDADDSASPILHVDMDAFYASVEVRRRPELRGRPVVVGGIGPRGVVSSASYEARRYGVRSAMPTARARALCPGAVYLPPDFPQYQAASEAVMRIFRDVTPLVEPLSLDEAFLDVTGARRLFGPPAAIARQVRARVTAEQGLTCSVGVAPSKFVAKLGSTRAKPDGLLVVPAGRVLEFLHPLPVDALWGVGERSAETLRRLGLRTIGDLAEAPAGMLRKALGVASATHLHELARGQDPRPVRPEQVEKSIGAELTFDVDVVDPQEIRRVLLALSEKVGSRLRGAGQVGRTVSLKVRLSDFRTVNRSRTLGVATDVAREIFNTSWGLWTVLDPGEPVRLVGVRVENLAGVADTPRQLTLGAPERGWREAETAADAAAARFGRSVIGPASLLGKRDPRRGENSSRP
ncbi:DNA polymerase IV [Micromonospora sp. NPDC051925]|uniref:DNA polymerase IV n=1 Tax=Micromonospora sp. NPDC051925 TaxID=3364288 RepID=UPI0037C8EC20